MLAKKHNDEKLSMATCQFWWVLTPVAQDEFNQRAQLSIKIKKIGMCDKHVGNLESWKKTKIITKIIAK